MAVGVVAGTPVGSSGSGNSSSVTVSAPVLAADEVHVIAATVTASGATLTTPANYTLLGSQNTTSSSGSAQTSTAVFVFTRTGPASAGSVTVAATVAGRIAAVPVKLTGVDSNAPFQASATGNYLTAPGIASTTGTMLVTCYGVREGTASAGTPNTFTITQAAGMTEAGEAISSNTGGNSMVAAEVSYVAVAAGSAAASKTATTTANSGFTAAGVSMLANPAVAGASTGTGFLSFLQQNFAGVLTHYYPLDSTWQAQDAIGTRNGTVTGGVTFAADGATFPGTAGAYIDLGDSDDFSLVGQASQGLTIMHGLAVTDWASTTNATGVSGYVNYMGKGNNGAYEDVWRYYPAVGNSRDKRTGAYYHSAAGNSPIGSYAQDTPANGDWQILTAAYDLTFTENPPFVGASGFGATNPGGIFFWKDGAQRDADGFQAGEGGTVPIVPANTTSPYRLGARADGGSQLKGKLRRVMFFNRRLTTAEVKSIYDNWGLTEGTKGNTVTVTPPSVPRTVTATRSTNSTTAGTVSWTAPSSAGNGTIDGYRVKWQNADGTQTFTSPLVNALSYNLTGIPTTVVTVTVEAHNSAGYSPPATTSIPAASSSTPAPVPTTGLKATIPVAGGVRKSAQVTIYQTGGTFAPTSLSSGTTTTTTPTPPPADPTPVDPTPPDPTPVPEPTPSTIPAGAKYVSPSGSDTAAGSSSAPWRTLSASLPKLRAGDTLVVRAGVYDEGTLSPTLAKGTASSRITVRGDNGAIFTGLIRLSAPDYWTWDNVDCRWKAGSGASNHMFRITGGRDWIVKNTEVYDSVSFACMHITGNPSNWLITGCYFHDAHRANATNQDHLLYFSNGTGTGTIERCIFARSENGRGIKVGSAGTALTNNLTIRYCTFQDNYGPSNIQLSYYSNSNTIERNIFDGSSAENVTVFNLDGTGNVARQNIGWRGSNVVDTSDTGLTDGGGNLKRNPLLNASFQPQDATSQAYGRYAP